MSKLTKLDLASLTSSGLNEDMIESMGITHLSRDELVDILGRNDFAAGETGYLIPYFDQYGNRTQEFNVRLHKGISRHDSDEGREKFVKYLRPEGSRTVPYFPPGFETLAKQLGYVVLTEGEKKAAKAVQEGIPCMAIAGVWNWTDTEARRIEKETEIKASWSTPPCSEIMDAVKGRKLILMFDSDCDTNWQVRKALYVLRDSLIFYTDGWVRIAYVPGNPANPDEKMGIDDWLTKIPTGIEDLKKMIFNETCLAGQGMLPLIKFPYATSSTGKELFYRIPNCSKLSKINIHSVYKDVEVETDDGGRIIQAKKICESRIWISRIITCIEDGSQKFEVSYIPSNGNEVQVLYGNGDIISFSAKGGADVYANLGCPVLSKERAEMDELMRNCLTYGSRNGFVQSAKGTLNRGWVPFSEKDARGVVSQREVFVYPDRVLTEDKMISSRSKDAPIIPVDVGLVSETRTATSKSMFGRAGSEELWRQTMITYVVPSVLPLMFVAASLAGPLRRWTKSENFIFHIFAGSSKGKSIAMNAAESIWGDPAALDLQWRVTDNGLESKCVARNDMTLFLDEAGASATNPEVLRNSAYMIGNGAEKVRATRDGSERRNRKFRLIALSTGERALLQGSRNAGQEVRAMDIPLDVCGVFWGRTINKAEVADRVSDIFRNNYGWGADKAIRMMMKCEKTQPGYWRNLHNNYTEVLRETLNRDRVPQHIVRRVANFGLIMVAVNVLLNVLGLENDVIDERIAELLSSASKNLLELSGDQFSSGEAIGMMEELVGSLASNRASHFYCNGENPKLDLWGSVIMDGGDARFYNIIPTFLTKICTIFDSSRVLDTLESIGALVHADTAVARKTRKKSARINGSTVSCYCVDLSIVQAYLENAHEDPLK